MRCVWPYWWGVLVLGLFANGCGEELGPVAFRTARVAGVVQQGGRPFQGGWIEFLPVAGTVGEIRSAPIGPGGTFVVERVAVGWNAIGLAAAPIGPELSATFHPLGTPILRRIPANGNDTLTIDLLEEAIRAQQARTPISRPLADAEPSR